MKLLADKEFIFREKQGSYRVNIDNMKSFLRLKREEFIDEFNEFNRITEGIDEFFKRIGTRSAKPTVDYLTYNEFYEIVAKFLYTSNSLYSTEHFPNFAYTLPLASSIGTVLDKFFFLLLNIIALAIINPGLLTITNEKPKRVYTSMS